MPQNPITAALTAEAAALALVVSGLADPELSRPSPCPPWTIGELLCHVLIGADRVAQALAGPDEPGARLVSTAGYYRPDERFSAASNADRIELARALARRLIGAEPAGRGNPAGPAIAAELTRRCTESVRLVQTAPAGRTVRSRHGDPMLLTGFAATRVVELGVHGLDVAIGLGRPPWLTGEAAGVLETLLLPDGGAARLRDLLGRDRAGLIALLTGRSAASAAEAELLSAAGITTLVLG